MALAGDPYRIVAPSAAALTDSLRGVGYSLETAVADLIDNSITAKAAAVEVTFEWAGEAPVVAILDDGVGMDDVALENAMRFGTLNANEPRDAADLGRFGLGLKTASLSQCRRLTVATYHDGRRSVLRWDLDRIRENPKEWRLFEGPADGSEHLLSEIERRQAGTLVLWELVDFGRKDDVVPYDQFLEDIEQVERHLSMVFHRYIDGDARKVVLTLNSRRVAAWDPFLERDSRPRPEQRLKSPGGQVTVRGFILPHRDRFMTEQAFLTAGGPAGWNAQQGFYIYRNKRMLSAGGWLGLGGSGAWTREEASRLARIRVDIPNTADRDWNIDVKKSIARPPASLRKRLFTIARDVRQVAREVFVHRGSYGPRPRAADVERIWEPGPKSGALRYRVRRDHPAVLAAVPDDLNFRAAFEALLVLVERTVPIDRIWLDVTERPGAMPPPSATDEPLMDAAVALAGLLIRRGANRDAAIGRVARLEPYDAINGFKDQLGRRVLG